MNDLTGNGHTLTNVSTTFGSVGGIDCAIFNGNNYLYCSPIGETLPFTVSFYVNITNASRDSVEKGLVRHTWGTYNGWHSTIINHSTMPHTKDIRVGTEPSNNCTYSSSTPSNGWHNFILACSGTNITFYIDGVKQGSNTRYAQTGTGGYFTIGTEYWTSFGNHFKGNIKEVVFEKILWSDQECIDYYNKTKKIVGK